VTGYIFPITGLMRSRSEPRRSRGNGYPLLWVHDQQQPFGIAKISDRKIGLARRTHHYDSLSEIIKTPYGHQRQQCPAT
jgi:hypothetical protein